MPQLINSLTIPFLLAMFLAVNMGASGTAPSFSAAYGANVIRRTAIPGLFGIMVLAGAIIAGEKVSLTLGKGLLEQHYFNTFNTSVILLSISLSLFFANLLGVPQSTSQSTVTAIAGAAAALDGLNTQKLFTEIIPTWVILPIVSFVLMFALCKWIIPFLKNIFLKKQSLSSKHEKILRFLLILSSLYVAFSIGSNNVANAAAPIASLTANVLGYQDVQNLTPVIILSMLVVAPCFAIGSSLMGHKVTDSQGKKIIEVSPFYATIIAFMVATLLLLASITKGIPTSLVQLNSAAFFALSITKTGLKNTIKNKTVVRYCTVWAVAPIFAFLLTYLIIAAFA